MRAAQMAQKTGMRIVGAVENMSYLAGTGQGLFGSGGGQALADEIGAPLLARIPLDPVLREAADDGVPVLEAAPDSEAAQAIVGLAEAVAASRAGTIRKPLTRPLASRGERRGPPAAPGARARGRPLRRSSSRTSPTPNDAGRRATASRAWRGSRRRLRPGSPSATGRAQAGTSAGAGNGALGYLVLEEIVRATLDQPPEAARVVVVERCFPTGVLGSWVRRLAEGGLVAALTATSPKRLPHPDGGPALTGTNPSRSRSPRATAPLVADVSMGAVTHGAVLEGRARGRLVPFGEQSHRRSRSRSGSRPSSARPVSPERCFLRRPAGHGPRRRCALRGGGCRGG